MLGRYKWTIRFIVLTPFLIIISFFLLGAGHGWREPTIILFPFATIQFFRTTTMDVGFLIASLIQYPVYGLLIDSFNKKNTIKLVLIILHILLAITSYLFISEHFPYKY